MSASKKVTLDQAIHEYLVFLTNAGKAANTIKNKKQALGHLRAAAGRDIQIATLSHVHIDKMFTANGWGATTHNLYRTNLNGFFGWCRARGYMSRNTDPLYGYDNRKVTTVEHQRIPASDWPALFRACVHPTERMLLALGLFLFLRGSEASLIKIGDIDLASRTIMIFREKTKEYDSMPITSELEGVLRWYMTWYTENYGTLRDSWYLVPVRSGGYKERGRNERARWTPGILPNAEILPNKRIARPYKYIKPILERAGYDVDGEGAHTLRRSGARALFDELRGRGYDGALRRVQSMLGHKSAKVTEGYLGLTIEKLQRNEELAGESMFQSFDVVNGESGDGKVVLLDNRREAM